MFQVPNAFPQHGPNSSSLCLISFALSSTLVTYVTNPKDEIKTSKVQTLTRFFFFFVMSQSKKKKKKGEKELSGCHPQLISWSYKYIV